MSGERGVDGGVVRNWLGRWWVCGDVAGPAVPVDESALERTYASTWQRHRASACFDGCWYCRQGR